MTQDKRLGDRHGRHVEGLQPVGGTLRVALVAGAGLATPAVQHTAVCLVNLLSRLVGVVSGIQLVLPSAPLLVRTPRAVPGGQIIDALLDLGDWSTGHAIPIAVGQGLESEFTICIGPRPAEYAGRIDLSVLGLGWRAWIGADANLPVPIEAQIDTNPLGPYFAASLGAGEVFKRARGLIRGRYAEDFGYSLWTGREGRWSGLTDGPPISGTVLPPAYLVGAGAVGQGVWALLAAADLASAYLVTIDDDSHDRTNFNRSFVAGVADDQQPKIDAVTRCRRAAGLDGLEFKGTLQEYVARADRRGLRADVAGSEAEDRYLIVISAVDKGTSRQDIQGLAPELVLGGSTVGLSAKANIYDMTPGAPCLACHNPAETEGAALREMERKVRTMTEPELRSFLDGKVNSVDEVVAYIFNAEKCGEVGEADFRDFAIRSEPEFSASFVSMAAAVLLTGRWLARVCFADIEVARPRMSTLAFKALASGDNALAPDTQCAACAAAGRRVAA
jgi:hypothetical protein